MNFSDLNIETKLKKSIELADFKIPTPIQKQSIPLSLEGKDVLGTAQTGTGKTLAFTIPMMNKLLKDKQAMALIICPTRELATQVMETILKLNIREIGIANALLIGGESMQKQLRKLNKRARIIVGTPGRINDHIKRKSLNLSKVNYLVLDETDRMLDMGFTPQIESILKFVPKNHQTLLFSATLPENILRISQKYLHNPERVSVGSLSAPIEKIKQETFQITPDKKYHELINQLIERNGSILVFVKTKHGADKIVKRLKYDGHKADAIHGNLRQSKRDRVIRGFRNGNSRILVATDVASRGLDIPVIKHVINYDLPQVPEDYIHRIGRTGRAGKEGSALTFLTNSDRNMWRLIQKIIDPNFKNLQEIKKSKFKQNKKSKNFFTKKKKFKEKIKFFKKEDNNRLNLKGKMVLSNKKNSKRPKFKKKQLPSGYTNNPKFFNINQEEPSKNKNNQRKYFKKKNKFKNRKRPKNFTFKNNKYR